MSNQFELQAVLPSARRRSRSAALQLCVLLAALGGSALAGAAEPSPSASAAPAAVQPGSVAIRDFMFSPMSLVVSAGSTVSWKNYDAEPHTIKSLDDTFRSGALDQNESFSHTFDKPGTYRYACSIHPQMVATIVVK